MSLINQALTVAPQDLRPVCRQIGGRSHPSANVAPLLVEGLKPSLVSKGIGAEGARQLHVALWGNDPGDNVFMDLKNKTRSELKHLSSGAPLTIGLEQECIRMLDRAVENYRLLHKRSATFVVQYERRAVARSPQAKAS